MASSRQLKHHAHFKAAVLYSLFPPPTNLPDRPEETLHQNAICVIHKEGVQNFLLKEQDDGGRGHPNNDNHDSYTEGGDNRRTVFSRAQRKRLKLKRAKEYCPDDMPKRFIRPVLPDISLRQKESEVDLPEKESDEHYTCTSTLKVQEVQYAEHEEDTSTRNTGETKDLDCIGTNDTENAGATKVLSRTKRRRLVKRKLHKMVSRHPNRAPSFTVEIQGKGVFIRQSVVENGL